MRGYRIGIAIAFAASVIALALIIFNTTPDAVSPVIRALSFLSLTIALGSAITLIAGLFRIAFTTAFLIGFSAAFLTLGILLIRLIS